MLKDVEDWKWRSNYSWKSIKCVSCDKNPRAINVTSKRNKTWHHAPSVTYFAIKMNSCFNHFFLLVNCIHKLHKKLLAYISSVIKKHRNKDHRAANSQKKNIDENNALLTKHKQVFWSGGVICYINVGSESRGGRDLNLQGTKKFLPQFSIIISYVYLCSNSQMCVIKK